MSSYICGEALSGTLMWRTRDTAAAKRHSARTNDSTFKHCQRHNGPRVSLNGSLSEGGSPNWGRSNGGSPNCGTPTMCSD